MKIDLVCDDCIIVDGLVYDAIEVTLNNGCNGCCMYNNNICSIYSSKKKFICCHFGKAIIFKKREIIEFDYDKIMQKETVVHCNTEEKAINLLRWVDSKGLKWCDGVKYTKKNDWLKSKEDMCYYLFNGMYDNLSYFKALDYKIYKYEDVIIKENKKKIKRNTK